MPKNVADLPGVQIEVDSGQCDICLDECNVNYLTCAIIDRDWLPPSLFMHLECKSLSSVNDNTAESFLIL